RLHVVRMHGQLSKRFEAWVRWHGRRSYPRGELSCVKVRAAVERYLAHAGVAEATKRAYASDLRDFEEWYGDGPLEKVDVRALSDYVADLGRARPGGKLAPSTIARRLAAVRALLRFSLGAAAVPDVPLAPRRGRRLPDAPKQAEVEALIDVPGEGR